MLVDVPQYIDVEDKIVGPLTAKQLGWMGAMGVILLILWNVVPKVLFFIIGIPVVLLFVALAFYRPYGQPLGSFVIFGIMYFFRPKIYFWKRSQQAKTVKTVFKEQPKNSQTAGEKHISSEELGSLAKLLDSEGSQYQGELDKILKNAPLKK